MNRTLLLIAFIACLNSVQTFSQTGANDVTVTEATTRDGKEVLLKSDGTWSYKPKVQSEQPEDSRATVYFYRVKEINGMNHKAVPVQLNGQVALKLPQYRFIGLKVPPGRYEIVSKKGKAELLLDAKAGMKYFVRVSETVVGYFWAQSISEVPEMQAKFQMRDLPPLDDKKSKVDFETVLERPKSD